MNTSESGCCHSTLTRPPESPSALAVSGRLMIGIFIGVSWRLFDETRMRRWPVVVQPGSRLAGLVPERLGQGENVVDVVELDAAGRGGAADEVEHLAVLQSVIGEPLHAAAFVEI